MKTRKKRTVAELDIQLKEMQEEKALFDKRKEIRDVKKQMRFWQPTTTTKKIIAFLLINCTVVEIYSMAAMWHLADLSALYALVTAVIGETISFAVYAAKAYHETKQEESIKLERDRMEMNLEPEDDSGESEDAG